MKGRAALVLIFADQIEARALAAYAENMGVRTAIVHESGEALRELLATDPQAIIAVEEAPPVEGVEFLSVVRRLTSQPIIVVGWGLDSSESQALFKGADVYLARPVNPSLLRAYLTALFRRTQGKLLSEGADEEPEMPAALGEWSTTLTQVERRVLDTLIQNMGRFTSHSEIGETVWGDTAKEGAARFYVMRLRRKLDETGLAWIQTDRGRGYVLKLAEAAPATENFAEAGSGDVPLNTPAPRSWS